jgi:hypothetical protein
MLAHPLGTIRSGLCPASGTFIKSCPGYFTELAVMRTAELSNPAGNKKIAVSVIFEGGK